jgi:DNA-binding MarR family transcriptional regulator
MKVISLDDTPGFWVYRAHTQGSNLFRKMLQTAGYDLTPEQCGVLMRLKECHGMNQSQLGKRLLKDRHNITRLLDLLGARGFVERRADEADKRIYRIFLTEAGWDLVGKLAPLVDDYFRHMLEGLTDEDVSVMRKTLGRIIGNLERSA